jgi:hypothetical protein
MAEPGLREHARRQWIGTVRVLNGTIVSPWLPKPGILRYTQPVTEGEFRFIMLMEAKVSETTSKLIYTVMWDTSQSSEAEINAAIERRRNLFT